MAEGLTAHVAVSGFKGSQCGPGTKPVLFHHRRHSRVWCGFEEIVCFPLSPFLPREWKFPPEAWQWTDSYPHWAGEAYVTRLQGRGG